MKRAFLSIILVLAILLIGSTPILHSASASDQDTANPATTSTEADDTETITVNVISHPDGTPDLPTSYPITRLGYTVFVDCPYTMLSQAADGQWHEADYIEPEFEIVPENVLWVIEPDQTYRMQLDLGGRAQNIQSAHLPSDTAYYVNVIYTGDVDEGGLGTFQLELQEQINDVFIVYRGVLKFVADRGANLFCTPDASIDETGILTVEFRPRQEGETYYHQFTINTPFVGEINAQAVPDWTKTTIYETDLSHYLYPHGVPEEPAWYFEDNPTLNPDAQPYRAALG